MKTRVVLKHEITKSQQERFISAISIGIFTLYLIEEKHVYNCFKRFTKFVSHAKHLLKIETFHDDYRKVQKISELQNISSKEKRHLCSVKLITRLGYKF